MKRVRTWQLMVTWGLCLGGLWGISYGAVADHVEWISINQGQADDGTGVTGPGYYFTLKLRTDDTVNHVEFTTPAGKTCVIGNDAQSLTGDVQTYHHDNDDVHGWEYSAWFPDIAGLGGYGDGSYQITVHYNDTSTNVTTVSYTVPGTGNPIAQPAQRPNITAPSFGADLLSPLTLTWDSCTDPNANSICVQMHDGDDADVGEMLLTTGTTTSDPCDLDEGMRAAQVVFEARHELTNADGIPCEVAKGSVASREFEVTHQKAYRFILDGTEGHFWTTSEAEKNKLIQYYPNDYTYEGCVFYAWDTDYYPDLEPVFRFWNVTNHDHFYTAIVAERDYVIAHYSHVYNYEGVAFYAYQSAARPPETVPLYRLWHSTYNYHYYTTDEAEKNQMLTPPTLWVQEVTTCYVEPLP